MKEQIAGKHSSANSVEKGQLVACNKSGRRAPAANPEARRRNAPASDRRVAPGHGLDGPTPTRQVGNRQAAGSGVADVMPGGVAFSSEPWAHGDAVEEERPISSPSVTTTITLIIVYITASTMTADRHLWDRRNRRRARSRCRPPGAFLTAYRARRRRSG